MKVLAVLIASALLMSSAEADSEKSPGDFKVAEASLDFRSLVGICRPEVADDRRSCTLYLAGFLGLADLYGIVPDDRFFCPPAGVTYDQVARIAVNWGDDYPDHLHMEASQVLVWALTSAFPCPKAK